MKNKIDTPEARDREIAAIGRSLLNTTNNNEEDKLFEWMSAIDAARQEGNRATTARVVIMAMVNALDEASNVSKMQVGLYVVLSWLYYRRGGKK